MRIQSNTIYGENPILYRSISKDLKEESMNILIVPSWYRNKVQPNNGSFFREQAKSIADKGHNVVVLDASLRVRKGWFAKDCMRFNKEIDDNITVYSYNFPSLFFGRYPLLYCLIFSLSFKYLIKRIYKDGFNVEIVHAHSAYAAGFISSRSKIFEKIPVVVTEHNSIFNKHGIDKTLKYILNQTIINCDKFICVSDDFAENIHANSKDNTPITVIPNMINPVFEFSPRRKREEFIFLSVGNLVKNKRMDLLIKAFAKKFKGDNKIKLRIVGVGHEKDNLEQLIVKEEVTNQIQLLGELDRNQLFLEYKNCDVFVLASFSETFGLAYREAMAVGRPIVSTLNGGINSDAQAYNGKFVDVDNENQLANALKQMTIEIEQFDIEYISKSILEKYGEKNVINQILECYGKLKG